MNNIIYDLQVHVDHGRLYPNGHQIINQEEGPKTDHPQTYLHRKYILQQTLKVSPILCMNKLPYCISYIG